MAEKKKEKKDLEEIGRFSVSMKKSLIEQAKKAAEKENRTLSNYIAQLILVNAQIMA